MRTASPVGWGLQPAIAADRSTSVTSQIICDKASVCQGQHKVKTNSSQSSEQSLRAHSWQTDLLPTVGMRHTEELRRQGGAQRPAPFPQSWRSPLRQAPEIHSVSTKSRHLEGHTVKQQAVWLQKDKHAATAPSSDSEQRKGLWEGMLSTKSHYLSNTSPNRQFIWYQWFDSRWTSPRITTEFAPLKYCSAVVQWDFKKCIGKYSWLLTLIREEE